MNEFYEDFYEDFHNFCMDCVNKLKNKEKDMFYPEFNGDMKDITQNDIIEPYPDTKYDFTEYLVKDFVKANCGDEIFTRFRRLLKKDDGITKTEEVDWFAHQFTHCHQEFPVLAKSINKSICVKRYGSCPFITINYSFSKNSVSSIGAEDHKFFFNTYKKYLKNSLNNHNRQEEITEITISPNNAEKNIDKKSVLDDDHNEDNKDIRNYNVFSYSFKDLESTLPGRMVKEIMGINLYEFFYNIMSYSFDKDFSQGNKFTEEFHMKSDTFKRKLNEGEITQENINQYFDIHEKLDINELKVCMTKIILFVLYHNEFSKTGEDISIENLPSLFDKTSESNEFSFIFNTYKEDGEYRNILPTAVYHKSTTEIVTKIINSFKKGVRSGGEAVWGEQMTPRKTVLQRYLISVCKSTTVKLGTGGNSETEDFWGQMNKEISKKN